MTKVAGRREVRSAETHEGQELSATKGGPALSGSDGHVAIRGAPLRAHTVLAVARCSMFTYVSYVPPVLRSHTVRFVRGLFDLGGVLDVLVRLTDQCSVHRVCRPRLKPLSG